MKKPFAKIFDLSEGQVLITKEISSEDGFEIKMRTDHEGIEFSMKLVYKSELRMDTAFEDFSENQAQLFMEQMIALMPE